MRILIILLVFNFFDHTLFALANSKTITAMRVENGPELTQSLDDPEWSKAIPLSGFRQREPFEGRQATERTEVRVLYDKRFLYFQVHCIDSVPEKIVSTELRRDADFTVDDHFSILISPNNDHQNGYIFTVNPLGTQFDALIANDGKANDPNWDGVWRSYASTKQDGWMATLAIPFSTLNFKTSNDVTIGINFRRFIRRKNEEDLWQAYLRIYGIDRISESGELKGLENIGSGRLMIMKPYMLGGVKSAKQIGNEALNTGGLDMKYGLRSDMVLNVTANTDFAESDVDPVRFNLTPFKIFIPEKRQFFLENGGVFQFGSPKSAQLFFSRQIGIDPATAEQVSLDVGAKITGSLGKYEIGFLDVKTRDNDHHPGTNFLVARTKRHLFGDSYIGGIAIDKENQDPQNEYNRSYGLDANFRILKRLNLQGFLAKTTSFASELKDKDWAGSFEATYESNLITTQFLHTIIQPHFNPEVGFVDRTDLVTNYGAVEFTPRPESNRIRQLYFIGAYELQENTAGVLQTQEWQATFIMLFHNGSFINTDFTRNFIQRLDEPFNIFQDVVIPSGVYHFDRPQVHYKSDRSKLFTYDIVESYGGFYSGKLNELNASANYRPGPKISIGGSSGWNRFEFDPRSYNVYVGSLKLSYSFNRFLTASLLTQVNSIDKNPVSGHFRLRYSYRPDSDLFVIYTVGNQFNSLSAGNPILTRESRFTVKLTYSWSR